MSLREIKNLAFEGGGLHGLAYGGVLLALDEAGFTPKIEKVVGSSSGAICASLLAIGLKPQAIISHLRSMDFSKFADSSPFLLTNVYRLIGSFGWYKGDVFREWISEQLESVGLPKSITLSELHALHVGPELTVIGTSLTKAKSVAFNHVSHPHLSVVDALRISMSFPLFFVPIRMNNELYVDGGILNSFPVSTFDLAIAGEPANPYTVGFRVNTQSELVAEATGAANNSIRTLIDFITVIIGSLYDSLQMAHMSKADWERTVTVTVPPGIASMNFNLKVDGIDALIKSGYNATKNWLITAPPVTRNV